MNVKQLERMMALTNELGKEVQSDTKSLDDVENVILNLRRLIVESLKEEIWRLYTIGGLEAS